MDTLGILVVGVAFTQSCWIGIVYNDDNIWTLLGFLWSGWHLHNLVELGLFIMMITYRHSWDSCGRGGIYTILLNWDCLWWWWHITLLLTILHPNGLHECIVYILWGHLDTWCPLCQSFPCFCWSCWLLLMLILMLMVVYMLVSIADVVIIAGIYCLCWYLLLMPMLVPAADASIYC